MTREPATARGMTRIDLATWIVVAVGIGLRAVAYLRRSTLWLDEAATARNIVERSLGDLLLRPLDYGQAAPKGFLLIEWAVTRAFGRSELAFRLVPFVAGVAALLLFRAIARRLLTPVGALAATLFFAVSYWFIVYSSDTHPYPLDLALSLAALSGVIVLVRDRPDDRRLVWMMAIAGAAGVWCSNGLVLTLFGLAIALGGIAVMERGWRDAAARLWPIGLCWGLGALGAVWVASHGFRPRTAEYFAWLWSRAMVPVPRTLDAALWLWRQWRRELAPWHGWAIDDPLWTSLYPALALLGLASLLRRRWRAAVVAGSIVASYVIVSMAKQYPYDTRFVLAPMAVLVLGIGESIGAIAGAWSGTALAAGRALAVLLCVPPVYRVLTYPPPAQWSVMGAYLAQIGARWQPGDVVYATYGSSLETAYHAPRFGIPPSATILGPCDFTNLRTTLRATDALRGRRRAWVIVGTGQYFPLSPEYGYLRRIGRRVDSLGVDLPGSIRQSAPRPYDIPTAYLFDLADPTRLARATADSYVLSPVLTRSLKGVDPWNCYGVNAPMKRGN